LCEVLELVSVSFEVKQLHLRDKGALTPRRSYTNEQ